MISPEKKSASENSRLEIERLHFKPEGYVNVDDYNFMVQFIDFIYDNDLEPNQLIFSGTDSSNIFKQNGTLNRPEFVFGMNEVGWSRAIKNNVPTPAGYAYDENGSQPCIALYTRNLLAHVYSGEMPDIAHYSEPVKMKNIIPGEALADLPVDSVVEEAIVHKDFPDKSPVDALVGIVYLED